MEKIISYTVDDIAVDPESITEAINKACCGRHVHHRVVGVCQIEDRIYFALLPLDENETARPYILVTVDDTSHDGFVSMLNTRWASGFDVVGTITAYDTVMALFAKPAGKK
ncbi:MAG: hypothetical protein K9N51_06325 [Candidatus Pacebacteria bacterium]|nr:hypothetical protein [Candidatus Paceibacterota bacterium]